MLQISCHNIHDQNLCLLKVSLCVASHLSSGVENSDAIGDNLQNFFEHAQICHELFDFVV